MAQTGILVGHAGNETTSAEDAARAFASKHWATPRSITTWSDCGSLAGEFKLLGGIARYSIAWNNTTDRFAVHRLG